MHHIKFEQLPTQHVELGGGGGGLLLSNMFEHFMSNFRVGRGGRSVPHPPFPTYMHTLTLSCTPKSQNEMWRLNPFDLKTDLAAYGMPRNMSGDGQKERRLSGQVRVFKRAHLEQAVVAHAWLGHMFLCPWQGKRGGEGVRGDHLYWRIQGSTSSIYISCSVCIALMWLLWQITIILVLYYTTILRQCLR